RHLLGLPHVLDRRLPLARDGGPARPLSRAAYDLRRDRLAVGALDPERPGASPAPAAWAATARAPSESLPPLRRLPARRRSSLRAQVHWRGQYGHGYGLRPPRPRRGPGGLAQSEDRWRDQRACLQQDRRRQP